MDYQSIAIDIGSGAVSVHNAGGGRPGLVAILGTSFGLRVRFADKGETVALPNGSGQVQIVAKTQADETEVTLQADGVADDQVPARYELRTEVDGQRLRTFLGAQLAVGLLAQIEWQHGDEELPRKSQPFVLTVLNSPAREGDLPSVPASLANLIWLGEHALRYDVEQTLTTEQQEQAQENLGLGGAGYVLPAATAEALGGVFRTPPPNGNHWFVRGLAESGALLFGDAAAVLPAIAGSPQVVQLTAVGVPEAGDAIRLISQAGTTHILWFRVDGQGSAPSGLGTTYACDITSSMSATDVAAVLMQEIANVTAYNVSRTGAVITVTQLTVGAMAPYEFVVQGTAIEGEVLDAGTNAVPRRLDAVDGRLLTGLPAPTATVRGAVMRNAGSAGQFVSGIDASGALVYGTPAGSSVSFGQLTGVPGDNEALAASLAAKASLAGATFTGTVAAATTTPATSGSSPLSPGFELESRGWKTDSVAGSVAVRMRTVLTAYNGTDAPQERLLWQSWNPATSSWTRHIEINRRVGTFFDQTELLLSGRSNSHARVGFENHELSLAVKSYSDWLGTLFMGRIGVIGGDNVRGFGVPSDGAVGWSQFNSGNEYGGLVLDGMFLARQSLGVWKFMADHATTPTPVTLKAHDVVTGTGASLTLQGGSGSAARGNVVLHGGNRSAYIANPSNHDLRDILISHGLMAAS